MSNFFDGVHYLFAGFGLITKPGIKRYVVIPLIINIIIFTLLFLALNHYTAIVNAWAMSFLPAWLQWLSALIWLLFFLGFFFIFIYTFAAFGTIAAAPFNGLLAQEVETLLTGQIPDNLGVLATLKDIPRVVGRQFSIIFYYLPRAVLLLILFFVPIVHVLAIPLWFLFSAWFLALQYLDFPTDNHRVPMREVRVWLQERRAVTLGFGMSLMFVMSIPVLNFFAIPAAAAGAAKFWVEENRGAESLRALRSK